MAPTDSLSQAAETGSLTGKRIGIVGMHYSPETTGNAPYTTALAESLKEAGASVLVVTGVPHYPQWRVYPEYRKGMRWAERDGRSVVLRRRHWVPRTPDTIGRGLMEATFLAQTLSTLPGLPVDALIAVTPMLSSMVTCTAWSRLTGAPWGALVQDLTGKGAKQSGVAGTWVSRTIERAEYSLLREAAAIGIAAPEFGNELRLAGICAERIRETPNFTHIEPTPLSKSESRRRLGWPEEKYLVVHTGNMGMKQALDIAIEAARSAVPDDLLELVLVGDGSQRHRLQRLANGLKSVRFVPPLSKELYPLALAAADSLLVIERNTAGQMSIPSKLTSYLVAERPIIASVPEGGITQRVLAEAKAGVIVTAGDSAALLAGINALRADQNLAHELAMNATHFAARNLQVETAASRYTGLAHAIISQGHRTGSIERGAATESILRRT